MNKIQKVITLFRNKYEFYKSKVQTNYESDLFSWDIRKEIKINGIENKDILAENMVFDGSYFLVFSIPKNNSIGLLQAVDPEGTWNYMGEIIQHGQAPHVLFYEGLWYVFYADRQRKPWSISVQTSKSIYGPYGNKHILLNPYEDWERFRCNEPFVIRFDGRWVMLYMGDSGGNVEQIGIAWSKNLLGPWIKGNNPVIRFGEAYDKGTVADPWIYEEHGIYYIGYACSRSRFSPWRTALALTTDFVNFKKAGIVLNLGRGWNSECAFRGALTKFDKTFIFPYTGRSKGHYKIGIAIKNMTNL